MNEEYPGASAYRDRHGKKRWRYRRRGISAELPGFPGQPDFDEAYRAAAAGAPMAYQARARSRREAILELFCEDTLPRIRSRALRKQIPVALTVGDVKRIMDEQQWRCAISRIPFDTQRGGYLRKQRAFKPSIDRIIPGLGYVPGNVRIVCTMVNYAMNTWGEGPLLELVRHMQLTNRVGEPSVRPKNALITI